MSDYEELDKEPEALVLVPTKLQQAFIQSPAQETLYGGARGGGKTFAVILDWLVHSETYGRKCRGLIVRRSLPELDEFIEEAKDVLGASGHTWSESKKQFRSPSGAILRCRYLENDEDAKRYQGHQYTRVYIEEVGNFPSDTPFRLLLATLRNKWGVPCQIKMTANPGGPGHGWVKARFIEPAPPFTPYSENNGITYRVYIPALVSDNPHITDVEQYVEQLKQSGSSELVRAWLEGDWDAIVGQYFDDFRRERHVLPTMEIPREWEIRYRAMDWGSSKPFAVLWFVVSPGGVLHHEQTGIDYQIPRGALVVYRELYGWNGKPNEGLRLTAEKVANIIRTKEEPDRELQKHSLHRLDPATFARNGGPSIAETMARQGIWFKPADNKRVAGRGRIGGWDQVRNRLVGEDGAPMIFIFNCCTHLLRTLPNLPRDPDFPDDVDTDAEDHAADALRYGCMARPWTPKSLEPPKPPKVKTIDQITMDEAWSCLVETPSFVR